MKLWAVDSSGTARRMLSLTDRVLGALYGLAFSGDGTHLLAAGGRALKVWDVSLSGDAEWAHLPASRDEITVTEFLPDGRRLVASSSATVGLTVWELETSRELRTVPIKDFGVVSSLDVSPDGVVIAAGGRYSGVVAAWDLATGRRLFWLPRGYDINDVAFSADGNYLVSVGGDGLAQIVDRSGHVIRVLKVGVEGQPVSNARFSADGRLLAVEAPDDHGLERVEIWDWRTRTVVQRVDAVEFVDFSPTAARIVTADRQGRGEIVDAHSGKRLALLAAEPGSIQTATFSPNGALVATAGKDGAVQLFDAETGAERLTLPSVGCAVTDVAFSHDGTKLASASTCDGVRVWALDIADLLRIARQNVTRSLTEQECRQYLHTDRCPQS